MKTRLTILAAGLALAGCATTPQPIGAPTAAPARPFSTAGLERIVGKDADTLERLFGKPDADVTEGTARKLQFASDICVLDAYLYPPRGGGRPVVTYVDARQRDGSPIDRASCAAALTRRGGGR
ncbi:hypothetical protein [Stakelama marina]|uniref:Lipoprotein n=1 Tax=Stakelama marina TaxID=2826939 RepID=A0A8T4IF25_9SPHN|nr:hypothetical protein [Stakelama marina]MBR0553618.1 hypothetical protein [Stakelama marina]